MKKFKKIMGWLHLWVGLASGLVILVVAVTGSLLTFEDELELVLFRHDHVVKVIGNQPLPADSLLAMAQAAFPGKKVSRLIIPQESDHSVEARLGSKGRGLKVVYLNPYTGAVLYKGNYNELFFQQVRDLHRYLMLGSAGKVITGISCCICLFLVISGLVIWWPANKQAVRQRFRIKWKASGKRLTWDLHAVTGFYLSIVLLLITLTGLVWSYDWSEGLIFKLADGKMEKVSKLQNTDKSKQAHPGIYQSMIEEVKRIYDYPGLISLTIPPKPSIAITVQKESEGNTMRKLDAAYFDSKTGRLIQILPYNKLSAGTRIRRMVLPIHTGSLLGWPTKILYLIVSLFTASLPITGMLIWWRRNKRGKQPKTAKQNPKLIVTGPVV